MSDPDTRIREGSSLYYSLLWTDPAARQRVDLRLGMITALITTLDDVQEPQVAEKKIHWWHEELQRLNEGCARHPALKQCQESLQDQNLAQAACLDIISAVSTERFTPFTTNEAIETSQILSFRARLALLAHALSADSADLDPSTHPKMAALAFAQHEQLIRLPNLIHRGMPVFSDEMYSQFNIRPNDLAEHIRVTDDADNENEIPSNVQISAADRLKNIPVITEKPGRRKLLSQAIESNQILFNKALDNDEVKRRYRHPQMLPIWRMLVLRKHQLDLWNKHQPDLLRERMTLTPLSKLFRAWQNRRS